METYSVRISGDNLIFSAAHFIAFGDGSCESLHGHDYRVSAELEGCLNASGYVVDFCLLDQLLREILARLDHRTLLPAAGGGEVKVAVGKADVEVSFADRCWRIPAGDCVLLPVNNTTSESLARHVGETLLKRLREELPAAALPASVKIDIHESPGRTASCRISI